jgi:hypothetical protein
MKKILLISLLLSAYNFFAQEHFSGVTTSSRVGILNVGMNPAELPNLSKKFEINIYGLSLNFSNNIIGIDDLDSDTDIENLLFKGDRIVNASADIEYSGPGVAMKWKKWGFGISSKGHIKFDVVDVDPKFANAILNTDEITENDPTLLIKNDYNQRMTGVSWGEIGFSAGRTVFENEKHRFNAGITLKLLFPGSYANMGIDKFQGNVETVYNASNPENSAAYLTTDGPVNVNFSYSGNLADKFTDAKDYTSSVFGKLGGVGTDLGINYQMKDGDKKYKINAGMSIRNIGSLTFKDSNNSSNSYTFDTTINGVSTPINLNIFDGTESLVEVEEVLTTPTVPNDPTSVYLKNEKSNKDFKTKLPTLFIMYADFKVFHKFNITGYLQQRMGDNNENRQITSQNSFSIIPRINLGYFEAYLPFSHNEISGGNTGLGLRLGGFYIGSSSVISTLTSNTKKVDFNMGFRWAFL